jgi:hypothetical protein
MMVDLINGRGAITQELPENQEKRSCKRRALRERYETRRHSNHQHSLRFDRGIRPPKGSPRSFGRIGNNRLLRRRWRSNFSRGI